MKLVSKDKPKASSYVAKAAICLTLGFLVLAIAGFTYADAAVERAALAISREEFSNTYIVAICVSLPGAILLFSSIYYMVKCFTTTMAEMRRTSADEDHATQPATDSTD